MHRISRSFFHISTLLTWSFLGLVFSGCSQDKALEEIERAKVLVVGTRNNVHCYYTYRDQPMGFEYELAKEFSALLGVDLEIRVGGSWRELAQWLDAGTCDIVAAGMTATLERKRLAEFSVGYLPVQQLVITHKSAEDVRDVDDLNGRSVNVRAGTPHVETLTRLIEQGLHINIVEREDVSSEELIEEVADGTVDMTVADSNIALLTRRYFPDIRIAFPIAGPLSLAWAVKKNERKLLDQINYFFDCVRTEGTFKDIYTRYYAYVEHFDEMDIRMFKKRIRRRLPKYEELIRRVSTEHLLDWRLVTALIYQESQFRSRARSFSGVKGIMQLTLTTAAEMGVANRLDPFQSITGGVKYLAKLRNFFDRAVEPDRTLIALAAYNVGHGHVTDAQALANEMGYDPWKWASLEKTLPLLRQRKFYKNSKYGYCRGNEPVSHVQNIFTYYEILKRDGMIYSR